MVAAVAGTVAVLADGAPTGSPGTDAAYRAAYAVGVTMVCAQARRWTWPIVAGAPLLVAVADPWITPALVALLLAVTAQLDRRRRQQVGAIVGALAAQSLLRLPPTLAFGVPSLIAALAPLPAALSAVIVLRSKVRRRTLRVGGAVAGALGICAVVLGFGTLLIRDDASAGASAARRGLEDLRGGDRAAATDRFATAEQAFADANRTATAWWMTPAHHLPVVAQNIEAAQTITAEGRLLARVSREAAPALALDDLAVAGRIKVERLRELETLAGDVRAGLHQADDAIATVPPDWLTGPIRSATDDLAAEIDDASTDADLAIEALGLAPDLLGEDRPRRYVVLFGNPAEARELGGFVASIGLLTADDGALSFDALPNPVALEQQLAARDARLTIDVPNSVRQAQPERFVRNWTDVPDIGTVAAIAADLLPQAIDTPVDGALYVDPVVLGALLQLTGPIGIPDTDVELTGENAAEYLLRGQYQEPGFEAGPERKDRLADAGEIAFDSLVRRLPPPRRLADILSPVVRARRLLFSTIDPAPHDLLRRVGLDPRINHGTTESLLITHGNRRANKLDAYLERRIRLDSGVDDAGAIGATVTVELTNTAPVRGLSSYQTGSASRSDDVPPTTNRLVLTVYSALELAGVTVDGDPGQRTESSAFGLHQYSIPVDVDAGTTATVEIDLRGTVDRERCEVRVSPNAASFTDRLVFGSVRTGGLTGSSDLILDRVIPAPCAAPS